MDASGNLDARRTYDVYGLARSVTGTPTSKRAWVGQLGHTSEPETGLVYMRARYMDPVTGMFISEDALKSGSNWFSYGSGSPTQKTDPSGHFTLLDIASGACDGVGSKLQDLMSSCGIESWMENRLFGAMFEWAEKYGLELAEDDVWANTEGDATSDMIIGVDGKWRILFHFTEDTLHAGQGAHIQLGLLSPGTVAWFSIIDDVMSYKP